MEARLDRQLLRTESNGQLSEAGLNEQLSKATTCYSNLTYYFLSIYLDPAFGSGEREEPKPGDWRARQITQRWTKFLSCLKPTQYGSFTGVFEGRPIFLKINNHPNRCLEREILVWQELSQIRKIICPSVLTFVNAGMADLEDLPLKSSGRRPSSSYRNVIVSEYAPGETLSTYAKDPNTSFEFLLRNVQQLMWVMFGLHRRTGLIFNDLVSMNVVLQPLGLPTKVYLFYETFYVDYLVRPFDFEHSVTRRYPPGEEDPRTYGSIGQDMMSLLWTTFGRRFHNRYLELIRYWDLPNILFKREGKVQCRSEEFKILSSCEKIKQLKLTSENLKEFFRWCGSKYGVNVMEKPSIPFDHWMTYWTNIPQGKLTLEENELLEKLLEEDDY